MKDLKKKEQLLLAKYQNAVAALQRFSDRERKIFSEFRSTFPHEVEAFDKVIPGPISTGIWVLKDGLILTRYHEWRGEPRTEVFVDLESTDDWMQNKKLIPTPKGFLMLARFIGGPGGLIELTNCSLGSEFIPYVFITSIKEDDPRLQEPEQSALFDFQLTMLGYLFSSKHGTPSPRKLVLSEYRSLLQRFDSLLSEVSKEEELQRFLKNNPLLLGPYTQVYSQFKLGDDLVADFVISHQTTSGIEYRFVEIKPATHKLFTRLGDTTAKLNHAIRQTVDWETWISRYSAYLRDKLPGFNHATFEIIIGRNTDINEGCAIRIKTMNNGWANRVVLTYDDLLDKARNSLENLTRLVSD